MSTFFSYDCVNIYKLGQFYYGFICHSYLIFFYPKTFATSHHSTYTNGIIVLPNIAVQKVHRIASASIDIAISHFRSAMCNNNGGW